MATNPESKFKNFAVTLPNGMNITGIHYSPPKVRTSTPFRPLIILLHGGTCTAQNFDVSPTNTASLEADNLSIPIVSINRPGYLDSSPMPEIPEDTTYQQLLGKSVYHEQLFPLLWEKYGKPEGCNSMVLLGHSMACQGIVIAAGVHAEDRSSKYPLAGIILSGWGTRVTEFKVSIPTATDEKIKWKQLIMLTYPDKKGLADDSILSCVGPQDHTIEYEEGKEAWTGEFFAYWRKYSDRIKAPIMYGIGEHDALWQGTLEHVKEYETMFSNCERFDGSVVLGAPHAIEWSYFASGWYARCFGFASEVSTLHGVRTRNAT
jgi:pimeloyl-ACP methyl ester carboxylesterase